MTYDLTLLPELEQLISQALQEPSWSIETAGQILFLIQFHNLRKTGALDENTLALCTKECDSFIVKGLKNGHLHKVRLNSNKVPKGYVAAAAGFVASTSPIVTSTLSALSPLSALFSLVAPALTVTPLILNKNSKNKNGSKQALLVPAEVMIYAKKYGKWLPDKAIPTATEQASPLTRQELSGNIESPTNPEVQLDEKALITKIRKEAGSRKGETWRNFIIEVLKPAVIRELDQKCLCLHRDLAMVLNEELSNGAKNFLGAKEYSKFNSGKLAEKIEDGIKNVFKSFDDSDNKKYKNVRSRVYRGNFYHEYDYVRCEQHLGK